MDGGIYSLRWPVGLKHTATRDRWFERFSKLKPGMNLREIAAELGEAYPSVYRWADLFKYDFPDLRREGRVTQEDWKRIDWSKRDAEIARELCLSRERVRQVRASEGHRPSAQRAATERFERWVETNREKLNGMHVAEILQFFGASISPQIARRLLRAHAIQPHDPTARWRELDWRLPNRDLGRIWSTSAKYIANVRAQLKVGPAKWDAKSSRIEHLLEYQQCLAQELIKSRGSKRKSVRAPRDVG